MKIGSPALHPTARQRLQAGAHPRFCLKIHALPLFFTLVLSSCATREGIYPTAMDRPDGRFLKASAEDSEGRSMPINRGVFKLTPYQRDILRIAKENYGAYIDVPGWDRGLYYTGRVGVFRWGSHRGLPLDEYAWNAAAGERWHVVREAEHGLPGLNQGSGMNPAAGYHTARKMTLTVAGTHTSPPPVSREPQAPAPPALPTPPPPKPIQLDGPVLTLIDDDQI